MIFPRSDIFGIINICRYNFLMWQSYKICSTKIRKKRIKKRKNGKGYHLIAFSIVNIFVLPFSNMIDYSKWQLIFYYFRRFYFSYFSFHKYLKNNIFPSK